MTTSRLDAVRYIDTPKALKTNIDDNVATFIILM